MLAKNESPERLLHDVKTMADNTMANVIILLAFFIFPFVNRRAKCSKIVIGERHKIGFLPIGWLKRGSRRKDFRCVDEKSWKWQSGFFII